MEEEAGSERQEARQGVNFVSLKSVIFKIIIKYSTILLILQLTVFWLFNYAPINLPDLIPYSPIKFDGFLLGIIFITILIFAIKAIVKVNPSLALVKLMLFGAVIGFMAEAVFQIVRLLTYADLTIYERIHKYFYGVTVITLFDAALCFFIAYQIKTNKTANLIGFIFLFIIVCNIIIRVFKPGLLPPFSPKE